MKNLSLRYGLIGTLGALLLTGCGGYMNDYHDPNAKVAMGPQPQVKIVETADATWIKPAGNPVEHNVPAPRDADQDAMSRLSALEHQVQAMQADMSSMMPVLTQMVATQTNIQTMLAQLQANGALPPTPPGTATVSTTKTTTIIPPPNGPSVMSAPPVQPDPVSAAAPIAANDTNANGAMNSMAATGDNVKTTGAIAPLAPLAAAPPPPDADKMPTPVTPPPDKMADASATPAALAPMSPSATKLTSKAPSKTGGPVIQDVRIGEHPGSTRIVLDISDKVAFSNDLDNDEHILTIDVKGAGWKGPMAEKKIDRSPLLTSWQTQDDGQGGTRIIMQLSKTAKVTASQAIPPSGHEPARIVLDLSAG